MIELSDLPVVDAHCHPFRELRETSAEELISIFYYSGALFENMAAEASKAKQIDSDHVLHQTTTGFLRLFVREMAKFLSCDPKIKTVVETRNKKAKDYTHYIQLLFEDAGIECMLFDDGNPIPPVDPARFKELMPIRCERVCRLERRFVEILSESNSFRDFLDLLLDRLRDEVLRERSLAFKSVIAYTTGLDIKTVSAIDAEHDFRETKTQTLPSGRFGVKHIDELRAYCLYKSILLSREVNVPFQLHTGHGLHDIVLAKCNPALLYDFLQDEEIRKAKIVLCHAGYPYVSEAAFIVNALTNVYMDLSELIPFACANTYNRINEALEIAPISKIMYGSDGYSIPEIHWIGAKVGKRALAQSLEEMINFGIFDEDEAIKVARMILKENAVRLYKL